MAYIGNGPGVSSQRVVTSVTATASQTTFTPSSGYTVGYIDVYMNGVRLINGSDYTADNGSTVVLTTGAALNDVIELVAYIPRGLSDGYTKTETDNLLAGISSDALIDSGGTTRVQATTSGADVTGNLSATGDLQLGSDSVASNINAVGDVFALNVDSNTNSGGTPNIQFKTSGTERMRIDSTGTVTIDGGATSTLVLEGTAQSYNEFAQIHFYNKDGSLDGPQVAGKISMSGNNSGVNSHLNFYVADSGTGVEGADPEHVMRLVQNGDLRFNSGFGSVSTAYGVRAWVNLNGTGTVAIRESGGVSSVTDVNVGRYGVNLSVTTPDTNYSPTITIGNNQNQLWVSAYSTTSYRLNIYTGSNYADDATVTSIMVR